MDKKFVKNVMAVVLGISVIMLITSFVSLCMDFAMFKELKALDSVAEKILYYVKWSAVGLFIFMVPMFASYIFAFFGKSKLFKAAAAVLSLALAATALVLLICTKDVGGSGAADLAFKTAFMQELLQVTIPAFLVGVYFIVETAAAVSNDGKAQVTAEENTDEEN